MIKKRKYKKRKRNPKYIDKTLLSELANAIVFGSPQNLINAKIYYSQGKICSDCGSDYSLCSCEQCFDCEYQKCLCDLDIDKESKFNFNSNTRAISNEAVKFANKNLTKLQLNKLEKMIKIIIENAKKFNVPYLS